MICCLTQGVQSTPASRPSAVIMALLAPLTPPSLGATIVIVAPADFVAAARALMNAGSMTSLTKHPIMRPLRVGLALARMLAPATA